MNEFSKIKTIGNASAGSDFDAQSSNPMADIKSNPSLALSDYSQSVPKPKYDNDIAQIVETVKLLNNLAPLRMPMYNFNLDEINGERYYRPDGTLLLVREYDNDVIRDYYAQSDDSYHAFTVSRVLEHDKTTGRLRAKIEPITRPGSRLKTNITIFDEKINNKYIIMQLAECGYVSNITEFTGKGKSFQTLFRSLETMKPVRYLEGKDSNDEGFMMVDCIFDSEGKVARIKKYSAKKEINIDYTEDKKNITVKNKG